MSFHTDSYKQIRERIIKTWPAWSRKVYNSRFAVSAHAEKIPEEYRTSSTPVWTHYDSLISKTPEELAEWLCEAAGWLPLYEGKAHPILKWLKSPMEEE